MWPPVTSVTGDIARLGERIRAHKPIFAPLAFGQAMAYSFEAGTLKPVPDGLPLHHLHDDGELAFVPADPVGSLQDLSRQVP